MTASRNGLERHYQKVIELGIALSAQHDSDRLMELILLGAKDMANADGGTLYLLGEDEESLRFVIMRNDSLKVAMGGTTGTPIAFPPLPLCGEDGKPNHRNVATFVALKGEAVNIEDAYDAEKFDFSGTKAFDERTGYRSTSFLTVPLKSHKGDVIGVLQLINARDDSGKVVPFSGDLEPLVDALAAQAAVALDNQLLIQGQKTLLDAFIKLIAHAIDAKSPYTGGHCQRVPVLTELLTRAAHDSKDPEFRNFELDEDGWYELHIAAWLHDCGKVTTPEYVVDKATKLETIYDRINTVKTRFEVLKRDAEIAYWKGLAQGGTEAALKSDMDARLAQIDQDRAFIEEINIGGEFMDDDKIIQLEQIATQKWRNPQGEIVPFLDENEVYNLSIRKGTLTAEERKIINDHIVVTIEMLEQLPFPKHLRNVVEYAGGHHEKMDGTGYPKGLKRDELSIPARIMAIADIFEALTAADRPYKKAKTLSESIKIMSFMRKDNHIDPDLFELFLRSGVWKKYAEMFLLPEQIDEVDVSRYLAKQAAE